MALTSPRWGGRAYLWRIKGSGEIERLAGNSGSLHRDCDGGFFLRRTGRFLLLVWRRTTGKTCRKVSNVAVVFDSPTKRENGLFYRPNVVLDLRTDTHFSQAGRHEFESRRPLLT